VLSPSADLGHPMSTSFSPTEKDIESPSYRGLREGRARVEPGSRGVPVAGTERSGTDDSACAQFDGANYQKADDTWLGWSGVRGWCDIDSQYNVDLTGSGIRSFWVRKMGSPGSTNCQP
jgi:hypothetical protein